jgi:hypothetical protein
MLRGATDLAVMGVWMAGSRVVRWTWNNRGNDRENDRATANADDLGNESEGLSEGQGPALRTAAILRCGFFVLRKLRPSISK